MSDMQAYQLAFPTLTWISKEWKKRVINQKVMTSSMTCIVYVVADWSLLHKSLADVSVFKVDEAEACPCVCECGGRGGRRAGCGGGGMCVCVCVPRK